MQEWPRIRRQLTRWLIGMIAVAAYFAAAGLGCSTGARCGDAVLATVNIRGFDWDHDCLQCRGISQ